MITTLTPAERLQRLKSLQDRKLVTSRTVGDYTVYKYTRKVFFNALWSEDPVLLDARGLVLDSTGNIVVLPFTKVFNYGENDTRFDRDEQVEVIEKINGFLGVISVVKTQDGTLKLIHSTTGSLDSDFVALIKKYSADIDAKLLENPEHAGITFLFEVCCPEDPHIVDESTGLYLIGARDHATGKLYSEQWLDSKAKEITALRPMIYDEITRFSDALQLVKQMQREGVMVYRKSDRACLKVKSPYYLSRKFISRSKKTEMFWTNPKEAKKTIDEEFYFIVDKLPAMYTWQEWSAMDNLDRLAVITRLQDENTN